jgi:hypothetical protein
MTVNGNPSNFPAKSESLCTPAYGTRTQNVTVNYTFPTIDNGLHDNNFTAIGFSTTEITAITNLSLNGSVDYNITVGSTTNKYIVKRTNNTEPKTYEITKTLNCDYIQPLPKNWKNYDYSTTGPANNRQCGPNYGACSDNQCCSSVGYCGTTSAYCTGSMSGGDFNDKEPKNWKNYSYSTDNRCGPSYNDTACPNNQCCSSLGYCGGATGANDAWCSTSISNGNFNDKEPTGRCTSSGIWGNQTVYNGNVISMTCPDGSTKSATCNNGNWDNIGKCPKYIFQTYASNGTLNTYVMPQDGIHWEEAVAGRNKDDAVRNLNYNGGSNRDGNRGDGIEFHNNSSTVFANSSNEDPQNSYGKTGTNSSIAVYNLTAPNGYTKESKYLYRYQSGADYVYAVFKNNNW